MAVKLWSTRTPGTAQLERDLMVMNNKKKVGMSHTHSHYSYNVNCQLEVIKMLMVVVALFTLAWLPLQVYGRSQRSESRNKTDDISLVFRCSRTDGSWH